MLRRACVKNTIVPVLCGSSFKNKGVQSLLDAVVSFLPSPFDVSGGEIEGHHVNMKDHIVRKVTDSEKITGLAFKIMTDPFVGRLTFARIYTGTLKSGSYIYNPISDKRERVGRLLRMHANHREDPRFVTLAGSNYSFTGLPGLN